MHSKTFLQCSRSSIIRTYINSFVLPAGGKSAIGIFQEDNRVLGRTTCYLIVIACYLYLPTMIYNWTVLFLIFDVLIKFKWRKFAAQDYEEIQLASWMRLFSRSFYKNVLLCIQSVVPWYVIQNEKLSPDSLSARVFMS